MGRRGRGVVMQIKTAVTYHLASFIMAFTKKGTCGRGYGEKSYALLVECKLGSHYGNGKEAPQKIKNRSTYDPAYYFWVFI